MTSSSSQSPGFSTRQLTCKSALVRSGIGALDYAVNPYVGCSHACRYCYATFMARYSGHNEPWGTFVDVKANLPEVLSREVRRKPMGRVGLSTVCDPYQPAEAVQQLTRRVLRILVNAGFPVLVMTKSDLVTRDIDLLKAAKDVQVEMTVTTLDEDAARFFEPGAPGPEARLEACRRLLAAGIQVEVFVGPALPYFADRPEKLAGLFGRIADAGVKQVCVDKFNYLPGKFRAFRGELSRRWPEAVPGFERLLKIPEVCAADLRDQCRALARSAGLECEVLF